MSLEKRALGSFVIVGSFMLMCVAADGEMQAMPNETVQTAVVTIHTDGLTGDAVTGVPTAGIAACLVALEDQPQAVDVEKTKTNVVAAAEQEVSKEESEKLTEDADESSLDNQNTESLQPANEESSEVQEVSDSSDKAGKKHSEDIISSVDEQQHAERNSSAGENQMILDGEDGKQADLSMSAQEDAAQTTDMKAQKEKQEWESRLLADVDEFLYIRESDSPDAQIVGKLYKGDVAEILESGDEWTHITSGDVEGFVKNEFCIVGSDAMAYAKSSFAATAESQTDGLRVRSDANSESAVLSFVDAGTTLTVDQSVETDGEWIAVKYAGSTGYVSAEFVETELDLGEAVSIEEERAQAEEIAAQKAKEEAERKANEVAETVQKEPVSVSFDQVTLLAALIQCEAGMEPYEGQVAVGAVVMNRVRSGGYANNIYDVIYQPSQFTPAGRGDVASVAARGPKASCISAAQEALNGADNTGGALSFRRASSGQQGLVIGNHVFF